MWIKFATLLCITSSTLCIPPVYNYRHSPYLKTSFNFNSNSHDQYLSPIATRRDFSSTSHSGHSFYGRTPSTLVPPQPIVTKHFYFHAAPEEPEEEPRHEIIKLGPARINYRVIFIKAPTPTGRKASVTLVHPQNEEKTVVYVLIKKAEDPQIQTAVHVAPTEPSKPEVFFIKYKTAEEAIAAQRGIQAQYDALGGTSQVSDEGFAPVSSVVGTLGGSSGDEIHSEDESLSTHPKAPYAYDLRTSR